ncbi:MAG: SDR family NAD(P)-dependent oxidoreductase [Candidatus Binatia bacterium]
MTQLQGKVALITGAGQGIGRGIALILARAGADIVVAEMVADRIPTVVQEIEALGRKALGVQMDVTKDAHVREAVKQPLDQFGRLDVLVNNAGIGWPRKVVDMTDKEWDLQINVNLKGTFYCCRAVLPHMIQRQQGAIINIASVSGWISDPQRTAYSAAKAGVMAFTRSLAGEVARDGIRVNAIAPGPIHSPLAHMLPESDRESLRTSVILKRWGQPEEIGEAVAFLASDASSYITGETMSVSGGMFMH